MTETKQNKKNLSVGTDVIEGQGRASKCDVSTGQSIEYYNKECSR